MAGKLTNTDRIIMLEEGLSRMQEVVEANRIDNAMQFQEVLRAIKDLKEGPESGEKKIKKKPKIPFGTFSDGDDEDDGDEESEISEKAKIGKKERDPLRDCRKLKMPIFEGEDAHDWIYRVERFQTKLLDRFQASQEGSVYEQFLNIHQESTVRDYVYKFEKLAGQLLDLPEKVLEGTFVKGLRPELRSAIRVMEPETLAQAMRIAIKMDENKSVGGTRTSGGGSYPRGGGGAPAKPSYTAVLFTTCVCILWI